MIPTYMTEHLVIGLSVTENGWIPLLRVQRIAVRIRLRHGLGLVGVDHTAQMRAKGRRMGPLAVYLRRADAPRVRSNYSLCRSLALLLCAPAVVTKLLFVDRNDVDAVTSRLWCSESMCRVKRLAWSGRRRWCRSQITVAVGELMVRGKEREVGGSRLSR